MRHRAALVLFVTALGVSRAHAQEPPPRIGPFVVDVHASLPSLPTESQQLADSRGGQNLGYKFLPNYRAWVIAVSVDELN